MQIRIILYLVLIFPIETFSQSKIEQQKVKKVFVSAGYGLAGSFFVRSYNESAPLPMFKIFYKKNFIGVSQNISLGISLKKNYQIRFGLHYQHFTRGIKLRDTLNNVIINIDHTIHHRDYMWFSGLNKNFLKNKSIFSVGVGIYYLRPKQEEVELYPGYFENIERDFYNSRLEEGGIFAEFSYEYKFQPRVNLGIRTQFYYTATAAYVESITLYPFIRISL